MSSLVRKRWEIVTFHLVEMRKGDGEFAVMTARSERSHNR